MSGYMQWDITSTSSIMKPSQSFEVTITVVNRHYSDPVSRELHLHPPLHAVPCEPIVIFVEKMMAGSRQSFTFNYSLTEGGRGVFWAWEGAEPLLEMRKSCCVIVEGAGHYSGDTHNHSTWSDGTSTLEENRASMLSKGHSFFYSTDHNTLAHTEEITSLSAADDRILFCHVPGWEFTTRYGHALAYGFPSIYNPKSITSLGNLAQWQGFVDAAIAQEAIVYLAHPFEAPRYEFTDEVLYGLQGITGIEVWNGFNHHAMHEPNRKAFDVWDNLNSRGDKRYYGNAVSDAHAALRQGDPFIKGWMEKPCLEEIHRLLSTGAFFGSNGPEVDLRIGDVGVGGVFHKEDTVPTGVFQLRAFDPLGQLERVTLYRNTIHPKGLPKHQREIVFEAGDLSERNKYVFEKQIELQIAVGQFYRVEVNARYGASGEGGRGTGQGTGFAYTNPIWIV